MDNRLVQVIALVEDLGIARRHFEDLGFLVTDGGCHPGRGTANLVIPFGGQYLELLAVVDRDEARSSAQGRPVVEALRRRGPGLARWSLESGAIADVSRRLGLPLELRERVRPDGVKIPWRSVAVDETWREPWRCAFMAWDDPSLHPGRALGTHPNGATGLNELQVIVPNRREALAWIGGRLPSGVTLHEGGDLGPSALAVATAAGPMSIAQ